MPTLAEIRAKYPQYSDLDDQTLLDGLHRKFYADMPREEFDKRLGVSRPNLATQVADVGEQAVRGINRGINAVAALPGEIFGFAADKMGFDGNRFRWNNPVSEFMASPQAQPQTTAGRYADAVGQAVGASAVPAGIIMGRAAQGVQGARAATTTMGQIGQGMVQSARANPGAVARADLAAAVGGGIGQQAAEDQGFGPVGQTVGGVIGGMTPAGIAGATGTARQTYRNARAGMGERGAYRAIARNLPDGVDRFADELAVGDTTQVTAINRRALDVLGEEMQRAGGNERAAQAAAVQRLSQEFGVAQATAQDQLRRIRAANQDSPLMLGEFDAATRRNAPTRNNPDGSEIRMQQPQNVDLDRVQRLQNSGNQETLDYLANNGTALSAKTVRDAVSNRQERLADDMRRVLGEVGPQANGQPASIMDSGQIIEDAAQLARQSYRATYTGPINQRELTYRLPRILQAADNRAALRAGDARDAIRRAVDQFYIEDPNGQRLAMMTLQQLQDARAVVRGQMDGYRAAGRNDLLQAVQPFYRQITQLMERASPQWAIANRQWADMNFLEIAERLGDSFATSAGPRYREHLTEFNHLAPQAQDIVRIHWLQKIYDKLDNLPDSNSVAKLFTSDHNRRMIREMLGDQAVVAVTRAVRDIKIAERSQRFMGNSATATRLARKEQMETEAGLISAVRNLDVGAIKKALGDILGQILTENKNRPMARILTTPVSNTPQVARHLQGLRAAEQEMRAAARPRAQQQPASGLYGPLVVNIPYPGEEGAR